MIAIEIKLDKHLDERERKEKLLSQIEVAMDKLDSVRGDILYGNSAYEGYTISINDYKKENE